MGNELDGKIRLDVKKLISAYPPYTKLPEVMKTHFDRLNAPIKKENEKIEAENKARAARVEPPLKKKGLNTSCVFQVSWALNAVGGGHEIPAMSPRPRSNALLSGKFHMGAVDELENYFLGRYGKPEIVKTSNRHSIGEMKKYMAGRPGIIAFRDKGLGMHTEIWNGSRILQNGAPIPNNTNGAAVMSETGIFGADRVLFWEILSENQVNLSAPWLFGWWTVSDIPSPYYYYFYPNGTVVYTRTEPRTNICPVARPEFTGSWNLTAPVGVRIKWSIEKYPVEILYYPPVASITMMAGVYESKAMPPFTATKKVFYR